PRSLNETRFSVNSQTQMTGETPQLALMAGLVPAIHVVAHPKGRGCSGLRRAEAASAAQAGQTRA
ncbi:MAG: hypothetical protein E6833_19940, partial [Bradyrhizobium sp.]|nr:hypothetical protein [Bradyrhizobium sp.]